MTIQSPHFVILAAGLGSRLGRPHPKCLTKLVTGETILERQIRLIQAVPHASVTVVIGFQSMQVMAAARDSYPDVNFVRNYDYETTNTSKSLLSALMSFSNPSNVIWMNGDVVFSEELLPHFMKQQNYSTVGTTTARVAEEEIKYTLDEKKNINSLSKIVPVAEAVGEAIGVNFVRAEDFTALRNALLMVENQDYFEKAMEKTIQTHQIKWKPFNLTNHGLSAIEIDFVEDLEAANHLLE